MTTAKPISELVQNYQPLSNSEPPQVPEAVCELWAILAEMYPIFTTQNPATPTDGWVIALDGLSVADIGTGIMALRESGLRYPPSAPEFRGMCRPRRRTNEAMYYCPPSRQLTKQLSDEERQHGREWISKAMEAAK
jgi:hypothetical protein